MFSCRKILVVVLTAAVAANAWAAKPAKAPETAPVRLPWTIRPHYEYALDNGTLFYNPQKGEWGVTLASGKMLIDTAHAEVVLADGTVLRAPDKVGKDDTRERFSDEIGAGNRVEAEIELGRGLVMLHRYRSYGDRPFGLLDIEVVNRGAAPAAVAKISPAVIPAGECDGLSTETRVLTRPIQARGGHPVFAPGSPGQTLVIQDRTAQAMIVLAAIPRGVARTEIRFESMGGKWQGEATCVFDPPVRLDPGQSLQTDTLFLSFGINSPARVNQYYAWATNLIAKPQELTPPAAWVTVPDGESASELYAAMHEWDGSGVKHVLVPIGWEGKPGSGDGGPDYPRDMKSVAQTIAAAGMTPGLTLEPWSASSAVSWTVTDGSGQPWVNFTDPAGVEELKRRVARAVADGFKFIVIAAPTVPNEVLQHVNVTRVQADWTAFKIAREASNGIPVFPASAAALDGAVEAWLEASAPTSRLREHGVVCGPVRLKVDAVEKVEQPLLSAMRFFGGPIELVGSPRPAVLSGISRLMASGHVAAQALDFAERSPRLWQVHAEGGQSEYRGDAVVSFPGAPALRLQDLECGANGPMRLWTVRDGALALCTDETVHAAESYAVHGVAPALARPVLMGAPSEPDLLLKQATKLQWNEETMELSGCLHGNGVMAVAYVYVPEGWNLHRGKMGNDAVKDGTDPRLVELEVPAGASAPFVLSFERQ